MLRIRDISLSALEDDRELLKKHAAKCLGISEKSITSLSVHRRSVDARKKNDVRIIYTVDVALESGDDAILSRPHDKRIEVAESYVYELPLPGSVPSRRPVVIGFGPAGMFASLILARAGLRPVVLERGYDADTRTDTVQRFWNSGELDPKCNVQFGEGGAGTFSDGKLNTGTKNPRIRYVLEELHRFGADESILYDAKPHVGTDILRNVVKNLRKEVISLGGEIRFGSQMVGIESENDHISAVKVRSGEDEYSLPCSDVILAIGHSARDTFEYLSSINIPMAPKPFAMGVRIEHRQSDINKAQYGNFFDCPSLGAADYKLAVHVPSGSAYTFCMCPGGYVVAAASEEGGVCTNGMSYSGRGGENANSALLVGLTPEDFPYPGPLGGMYWQRDIERCCFEAAGGDYSAPAQTVGDFLGLPADSPVSPTYRPGVTYCDLRDVLPRKITDTIAEVLPELDKKLHGFASPNAVMTAPEARSSSPVRILRDELLQSSVRGLYPCGEGAGYAGGIMSAAVDGIICAEAIIKSL